MENGGTNSVQKSKHLLKLTGLILPIFLALYGLLVINDLIPGSSYITTGAYVVIISSWVILSGIQVLLPPQSPRDTYLRLIGYHILAGAYLILVSGLFSPLAALWPLLILASYVYSGVRGLTLNFVTIIALLIGEVLLDQSLTRFTSTTDAWLLLIVMATGLVSVAILKYHEIDQLALIRSQKQEMIQRERTLTLVNNLADAVLSTDPDGTIRVYNAAALSLLDTNDSLNGRHIDEVINLLDEDGQPVTLLEELKRAGRVTVRDDLSMQFDEERIRLEVTLSTIRGNYTAKKKSNHDDGYIIILRDITASKSLEEERDEFISVVSHELRTPITIAEGTLSNVQLLIDRGTTKPETVKSAVHTAHDQVLFLARMVNDLSTLSRAERGVGDTAEDIDIKELVYKIYNNYQPEAEAKGLQLNLDTTGHLGEVHTSRLYLEELIQNFITNAIKYTHEGSITFSTKRAGNKVTFSVRDTGIGISKSAQKKIFDKFYRAEDYRTRETNGTGLGLYVSAKLARKLDTEISLESRLNHGSTFSFSMPVTKPATKPKANTASK